MRAAALSLFLLAGCAGGDLQRAASGPAAPAQRRSAAAETLERGASVFSETCLGCHTNPPAPRPDFAQPMTRELASRALSAIFGRDMPPPTSAEYTSLGEADRASLLSWLCARTARNQDTCARLVRFETAPILTRTGPTILGTMKKDAPSPVSIDTSAYVLASSPTNPNGYTGPLQTVLDARLVGVVLMAAIEACAPDASKSEAPTSPPSEEDQRRCVERLVARAVEAPKPTHP